MSPRSAAAAAAVALAVLSQSSEGVAVEGSKKLRGAHVEGSLATVAMHMYRGECSSRVSLAQTGKRVPGAGMNPESIKPFMKVMKDGFYEVECVQDYMYEYGDKFGNNKGSYKLAERAGVSIVNYADHVPKEDREPMSHETCFRFCRTVDGMTFFGLHNGRDCYCTPYYEAEAGDSSMCDEVCEGNPGTMCGGKSKSSIFGMHACSNTATDLSSKAEAVAEAQAALAEVTTLATPVAANMQTAAAQHQDAFGQAGDPGASDLLQTAKVFAGEIEEALGKASKADAKLTDLKAAKEAMAAADFSSAAELSKAEDLMQDMEAAIAQAEASTTELQRIMAQFVTISKADPGALDGKAKQYYSAVYFVDQAEKDMPSTCTGTASETPFMGSMDECARACDNDLHECVGFSFFGSEGVQVQDASKGLCFLMSNFKTITYFTGCAEQGKHADTKCFAKLAKFEGTTLKPDGSGKCKECFKEAKKADRCWA